MIAIDWHFPMRLQVSDASIPLHGILEALGIFLGFRYYLRLRKNHGDTISSENRIWIVIAAALGAVFGSRLVGAMENLPEWMHAANRLSYFWGNKTLVGGLLGGLAGVEFVKKLIGEQQRSGDLFVYPLILGMLVGRLGCFSAGISEETYGLPTTLPWAMNLGDGILRHPAVLYEMFFLLVLWCLLAGVQRSFVFASGAVFKLFLIGYLIFRFMLDFIKPGWRYAFGLGTIQLVCLAGLLYYSRYLLNPRLFLAKASKHAC